MPSLVKIMACLLFSTKPLSETILAIWTMRNKLQWNFNNNSHIFIQENAFENVICEMASIFSRPQCVKFVMMIWLFSPIIVPLICDSLALGCQPRGYQLPSLGKLTFLHSSDRSVTVQGKRSHHINDCVTSVVNHIPLYYYQFFLIWGIKFIFIIST